ncbi:MAG: GNAT family N-acetyltransferase [Kiritimatiellaeota bacterium]|nr:GNAT family N-acetyltransferase [Kiritimatiellota bacterium]
MLRHLLAGLALEDFRFRKGAAGDSVAAEELHRACLGEYPGGSGEAPAAQILTGMGEWVFPGSMSFVAETAAGEFAGYASAALLSEGFLCVRAIEVKSEYRGLGLGKTLITRLLEQADSEKIPHVTIDLPAGQEHFSRVLLRESFKPCVQRYWRGGKGED